MSITPSKIQTRQKIITLLSAGLAILLGVIQLCFYLTGYEFDTGLYHHGPLSTLTIWLWTLAGASVVALSLTLPKKQSCEEFNPPRSTFSDFSMLICAGFLASVLLSVFIFRTNPADSLSTLLASRLESDSTARTMLLLSLLTAIPSVFHFLLYYFKGINHPLGITAVLFFTASIAMRVYFDMRYLLMSPRRILHLMALLSVMLFLIAELRAARGLGSRKIYFALSTLAVVFAFADAFSNLLLSMMGWQTLGSELTVYFFLLSMALYAFSRLFSMTFPQPRKKESAVDTLLTQTEDVPTDSEDSQS